MDRRNKMLKDDEQAAQDYLKMQKNASVNMSFKTQLIGGKPMIFWDASMEDAAPRNRNANANAKAVKSVNNGQNNATSSKTTASMTKSMPAPANGKKTREPERGFRTSKPAASNAGRDSEVVTLSKAQLNALLAAVTNGIDTDDKDDNKRSHLGPRKAYEHETAAYGFDEEEELQFAGARGNANTRSNGNASMPKKAASNGRAKVGAKRDENIFALLDRAGDSDAKPKRIVLASDTNQRIGGDSASQEDPNAPAWKKSVRTVREQQMLDKKRQRQLEIEAKFEGIDVRQLIAEKNRTKPPPSLPKPHQAPPRRPIEDNRRVQKAMPFDRGEPAYEMAAFVDEEPEVRGRYVFESEEEAPRKREVPREVRIPAPDSASTTRSAPKVPEPEPAPAPAPVAAPQPVLSLAEKKRQKWAAEQVELQRIGVSNYNPYGRPGAGAPPAQSDAPVVAPFITPPDNKTYTAFSPPRAAKPTSDPNDGGMFSSLLNSDLNLKANREKERQKWLAELAQQRVVANEPEKPVPSFGEPVVSTRNDANGQGFARGSGFAALLDPLAKQELDERKRKQLEYQAAIAAQIQERARLKELERKTELIEEVRQISRMQKQIEAEKLAVSLENTKRQAKEQRQNVQQDERDRQIEELQRQLELARTAATVPKSNVNLDSSVTDTRSKREPEVSVKARMIEEVDSERGDSPDIMFAGGGENRRVDRYQKQAKPKEEARTKEGERAKFAAFNKKMAPERNEKPPTSRIPSQRVANDRRKPAATNAPVRNRLADVALDNVIDEMGWKSNVKAKPEPTMIPKASSVAKETNVNKAKPRRHNQIVESSPPSSPPPPQQQYQPPASPPIPAVQRRMQTIQAVNSRQGQHNGDYSEFANDYQTDFDEVPVAPARRTDAYRDLQPRSPPPVDEYQFAPFVRTSAVLDPAHSQSPTEVSREASSVQKARESYEKQLNPAFLGDQLPPPKRDKKQPFASKPLIRGSFRKDNDNDNSHLLMPNVAAVALPLSRGSYVIDPKESSLAASADASRLLTEIRKGLAQRQREIEVTLPNTVNTDDQD